MGNKKKLLDNVKVFPLVYGEPKDFSDKYVNKYAAVMSSILLKIFLKVVTNATKINTSVILRFYLDHFVIMSTTNELPIASDKNVRLRYEVGVNMLDKYYVNPAYLNEHGYYEVAFVFEPLKKKLTHDDKSTISIKIENRRIRHIHLITESAANRSKNYITINAYEDDIELEPIRQFHSSNLACSCIIEKKTFSSTITGVISNTLNIKFSTSPKNEKCVDFICQKLSNPNIEKMLRIKQEEDYCDIRGDILDGSVFVEDIQKSALLLIKDFPAINYRLYIENDRKFTAVAEGEKGFLILTL